ncbi:hypothetical protein ABZ840_16750 [Streptomyces sp. NPDC047117]|uniref:hypothetical protein n=1 Tax=Streptomyces sp. NPDC047117 TaxID=3155379 RepID=UPI0033F66512
MTAFCDESLRRRAQGDGIYLLSAILLPLAMVPAVREEMSSLRLSGQRKLHWRDEGERRRPLLVSRTASIGPEVLIATWCAMEHRRQERARRKAMQTLLAALGERGVTRVLFESRGPELDRRDIAGLAGMRGSGVLPPTIRVDHAAGATEHALWTADIVLGAFGAALDGDLRYWSELRANTKTTVLTCGQCAAAHGPAAP